MRSFAKGVKVFGGKEHLRKSCDGLGSKRQETQQKEWCNNNNWAVQDGTHSVGPPHELKYIHFTALYHRIAIARYLRCYLGILCKKFYVSALDPVVVVWVASVVGDGVTMVCPDFIIVCMVLLKTLSAGLDRDR